MFARIEVAMHPDFIDPKAQNFLERLRIAKPELREKVRWARWVDVFWLDLPVSREEMIAVVGEVYWDRVLQFLFTGNMIPSAAGKHGSLQDILEHSPHRPGNFFALERRFRPGVTDNIARTSLEACELMLGKTLEDARAASGSLLIVEGDKLDEEALSEIARGYLCNELIETWSLYSEAEILKSDRFHQERIKRDLPKPKASFMSEPVEFLDLGAMNEDELEKLSQERLWALTRSELLAIRGHFGEANERARRQQLKVGGPEGNGRMTDVEIEVLAQTWSEHCKHKIFGAEINYQDKTAYGAVKLEIPPKISSLFRTTITQTTAEMRRPWLLSVFEDNAGIVAFDDEHAFCIKVETHNTPSALDPYGGSLTGIVGVNRDILGCGLGAKPIFNTDVFCLAAPDYAKPLPDRLLHPRRILDGVRRGVEDGGNKSGIPTVNGALFFDDRYLGKPLIYCGTGGFMPRVIAGRKCEAKEITPGDYVVMVGGRIGKDGIHGATFSSLALDEFSPTSAVQLGDPITQKRAADFLLEARDMGLYRAVTDNGAGGLSSSVGEMARLSGGARMDVSLAKVKYPGLKPYELVVSESQERMTLAVPKDSWDLFEALAKRRGVEVSKLGEFNQSGNFDIFYGETCVASLPLSFLHGGAPKMKLEATWSGPKSTPKKIKGFPLVQEIGGRVLLEMLGRPNVASKEWLIRQYDHEVQGMSVIKPLQLNSEGVSGPNDGGVIKPKVNSNSGIAVSCGLNPRLSDYEPFVMAQAAVDEAVRNALCVGAEYGTQDSVMALVDNFCWPDPVKDTEKCGALVRTCFGLRDAALGLGAPFVSGKDSMKNDYKGKLGETEVKISVPPTLLVTAVSRVKDISHCQSSDFKASGDLIYLLGGKDFSLIGSEIQYWFREKGEFDLPTDYKLPKADWPMARLLYSWLGRSIGKEQARLKSIHDISDGGLMVCIAESMLTRGFGAFIQLPNETDPTFSPWEFCFGEGFHSFIVSIAPNDQGSIEAEWEKLKVPFKRLGSVTSNAALEVRMSRGNEHFTWKVGVPGIRAAWKKEGYFQ